MVNKINKIIFTTQIIFIFFAYKFLLISIIYILNILIFLLPLLSITLTVLMKTDSYIIFISVVGDDRKGHITRIWPLYKTAKFNVKIIFILLYFVCYESNTFFSFYKARVQIYEWRISHCKWERHSCFFLFFSKIKKVLLQSWTRTVERIDHYNTQNITPTHPPSPTVNVKFKSSST